MSKLFDQLQDSLSEINKMLDNKSVDVRVSTVELKVSPLSLTDSKNIKRLRIRLGLSQQQFADVLGVKKGTVSKWEQGVNLPTGASLRLIEIITKQPEILESTEIMSITG